MKVIVFTFCYDNLWKSQFNALEKPVKLRKFFSYSVVIHVTLCHLARRDVHTQFSSFTLVSQYSEYEHCTQSVPLSLPQFFCGSFVVVCGVSSTDLFFHLARGYSGS